MVMLGRKLVAGTIALGALLSVSHAAHADVQACIAASEKGQRARAAGKLREAREHFLACGVDRCPTLVRHDCASWNSELAQTLPSVVFGARDKQGRDLFDVAVSMDGEPLVTKLDGKSVTVDPGRHTFRFEMAGYPPFDEVALIKEGERARVINVTLGGGASPSLSTEPGDGSSDHAQERGHTPYPWIVAGVGAVGIVVGAAVAISAPDRPAGCNSETKTCTRLDGQSDADFRKAQADAGQADSQPILGYAIVAGGAALVVGGLLWHFLEPTGAASSATRLRVAPWTTGTSSGLALGARF